MIILALSTIAGVLYRLGGTGGEWYLNTKVRDFGVPFCAIIYLFWSGICTNPLALFFAFGTMFASMTTYHKWVGFFFGYTDDDVHWPSWAITGLVYGLSALPICIATGLWVGFGLRAIVLAITVCLWSEWWSWDIAEEFGRGFLFCITLPLLAF